MRKSVVVILILLTSYAKGQSVLGYWYGIATPKSSASTNNYMVELVLEHANTQVKGIINYYFKDTYRSIALKGKFDPATRMLTLTGIPLTYHGSLSAFSVDCIMDFQATLRVAKAGSTLLGSFYSRPDYQYTCPEVSFKLNLLADISKRDSVLHEIALFKENYQVWKPQLEDTLVAVAIVPKKEDNPQPDEEFTKRQNEIAQDLEVESDKIRVDVYDNGEVDGDRISLFFNKQMILSDQKLTHKSIHIDLTLDENKEYNELTMFAENLGRIPPNTALFVVYDGKKRYEISLSSNLDKNATIRIKKRNSGN